MEAKAVYNNFIDEYVYKAPLFVYAFTTDADEVHIYIIRFTSANAIAQANMVAHAT